MYILQFTLPHHQSLGGLYPVQKSFRNILNAKIVDIVPFHFPEKTEADYHIKVFDYGIFKRYGLPVNARAVISELSNINVNLVIIHCLFQVHSPIGYWLANAQQIPYIIFLHGTLDPYVFSYRSMQKRLWMYALGNRIIRQSSAIVCTTTREAQKAREYLQGANVEICPLGVNTPYLPETANWRKEIRNYLGISLDRRVLLFLGRVHQAKRIMETALAFKQLKPESWIFLVVGPIEIGGGAESIQEICNGVTILYHPPVYENQKWKFLAACDAFVHLSYKENFGISIAEAAAIGLPILMSDGVDIFPLMEQAGAADVVHIESYQDIYDGLSKFLQKSPAEHIEMGERSKKVFQANFTQASFEERVINLANKYAKN